MGSAVTAEAALDIALACNGMQWHAMACKDWYAGKVQHALAQRAGGLSPLRGDRRTLVWGNREIGALRLGNGVQGPCDCAPPKK